MVTRYEGYYIHKLPVRAVSCWLVSNNGKHSTNYFDDCVLFDSEQEARLAIDAIGFFFQYHEVGALMKTGKQMKADVKKHLLEESYQASKADEDLMRAGIEAGMRLASKTAAKWYINPETGAPIERNFGEVIALMHSELSEALEGHRKGLVDGHLPEYDSPTVEFADLLLRVFDTAAKLNLELPSATVDKNRYNDKREDHKTKNRVKAGGKKY
jgi:hypothetical protein